MIFSSTGSSNQRRRGPSKFLLPVLALLSIFVGCKSHLMGRPITVAVNQTGYPSEAAKLATVATTSAVDRFSVHRLPGGEVVLEGILSSDVLTPDSGGSVRVADFSILSESGTYELRVGNDGRSAPFAISERPYDGVLRLALRSYYGQRCGIAVDLSPDHPIHSHDACHRSGAYHRSSGETGERPSIRGWHDAGDYGRYVVNSGIATGTLLWAWEMFPEVFRDLELSIPESGDTTPDLLDEVRWNLEWMLSMQDDDGGVWHKQTSEDFAGMVLPEKDHSVSFVIGTGSEPYKSSCATADFAAVMAIAARAYEPFDDDFAHRSHQAAMDAWRWLSSHPEISFRNPEGILTGEYGDEDCHDERLWAAAEIWRTTGDSAIENWFLAHAGGALDAVVATEPPSWKEVGAMAAWSYALSGKGDSAVVRKIIDQSILAADEIVARSIGHGYRTPLVLENYEWGSNGVAANYGLQLLVADTFRPDRAYRDAALEIVHYLLGRNPHSISFVTGTGSRSVMHPHHRPSIDDQNEAPWPGLLAGGPNRNRQDPALESLPPDTPPAMMYVDTEASYASNEIAINWNAPLVFLLGGVVKSAISDMPDSHHSPIENDPPSLKPIGSSSAPARRGSGTGQ